MTPAQFLEYIVSVSIQATIVVCITHWLCRVVTTPRRQCRLWNTCHLLLLLILLGGIVLPHLRATNPWHVLAPRVVEQVVAVEAVAGRVALVIWVSGASVSLILLIREWLRAFRFLKSCRVANEQEKFLVTQAPGIPHDIGGIPSRWPVRLLMSHQLSSPFCFQWHQPCLVIPEFLLGLRPEEIKFVTLHELEHLHSGHPLQLFIERLVSTAFWFHPTISWASRQSALAREYACDDVAVTKRQDIVSYLKFLVAMAERGLSEEANGAALFFGRGASVIALRGKRLLDRVESASSPPETSDRLLWAHAMLAVLALGAWFIWAPLDALASTRTKWSPWPRWSATVLRTLDIPARDFEPYEIHTRLHELSTRVNDDDSPGMRAFPPRAIH